MRVGICTPDLAHGDAVSNDVVGMFDAITDAGFQETRIFATNNQLRHAHVSAPETIPTFLRSEQDVLIYHHSVGWDLGIQMLRTVACRKVIKYHNVTPPDFFEGLAENYVTACRHGRLQLMDIVRAKPDVYLADSLFNLREISELDPRGVPSSVVPPFHHIDRLEAMDADNAVIGRYSDGMTNILMVGRVAPNKGHSALIDAFAEYWSEYNRNSRLLIVGGEDPGLVSYSLSLQSKVRDAGLDGHVIFTGKVTDQQLKAFYAMADVFLITSLHEGFCVPVVEAMAMGIPVVAFATTAVPETLGDAGIAWDEPDPGLLAGSVDRIVRDQHVRSVLSERGNRRYRESYSNRRIKEVLLSTLRESGVIPKP